MGRLCFVLIAIQCLGLLFALLAFSTPDSTLKLIHVVFRHGERSPSKTYTNDPHKNHKWPGGWDQLSTTGKIEEYDLGLWLRRKYDKFLPSHYELDDIIVHSSYADRCIMSAQLLLAALYPPQSEQIWNQKLLWQPIPVHSIPRYIDNKIAIKQNCPAFLEALASVQTGEKIGEINHSSKDLYDYLTLHTGDDIQSIASVETLYNTLEIEKLNNLTLPDWTIPVFPEKMVDLAAMGLAIYTENDFMKKLHGGVLAKEILTQMKLKCSNKLVPNRKMVVYSGHDLTVVTILRVLGFEHLLKPEFGSAVVIELHEIKGENIVKFIYKKNPYDDEVELNLENCRVCTLQQLEVLLKPVIPSDWEKECIL